MVSHPVKIFVLELVSSGFFGEQIGDNFRAEGRAMLDAVLADLQRIPEVSVNTIIDDLESLRRAFNLPVDVTLCIAPEFGDLLWRFSEFICRPWMRSLNCEANTLRLCADKWWFHDHLKSRGIPTIPTRRLELELSEQPSSYPCVVKPRDGAGSLLVRRVTDRTMWPSIREEYVQAGLSEVLVQPEIKGIACSIAALVRPDDRPEILPVAEQRISDDGTFAYLGGTIPANLPPRTGDAVRKLFQKTLDSLEGLQGYVGCDVIIPEKDPLRPVIVELNPRLTTSYIGYRQLCEENLMERLLFPERGIRPLRWRSGRVEFDSRGLCQYGDGPGVADAGL